MGREIETETDLLPPRYRDVRRIGSGGMGDIYRATDSVLGRDVAVKVLAERYAQDESVRNRFKREALAAAKLSGAPSTVTIFDVGEHEDRPFIVMEYLPGGSLEDRLREDGANDTTGLAISWLEQAAMALDAAHDRGIVHRDVKPANLLLDADDNVHVADFGIASAAGMASLTKTGTVLGTAGYLAPEQALGERTTSASDRYALGVVAYELLTGTRPFDNESPTAEAAAHVHAPVPSISQHGLPRELDPVFQRALAKDPAARFPSCAEFVAEIRDALSRSATATRTLAPVSAPVPARVAAPARHSARPWPILAAGAIAIVLAGGALAAYVANDDETSSPPTGPTPTEATPSTLVTTVVQTQPGTTEQVTVTATVPPADVDAGQGDGDEEGGGGGGGSVGQGIALTDQATGLLGQDDERALALALQAIPMLEGRHRTYEAYASYDAGRALANLGRCDEAIPYLDRSESIQGPRREIRQARADCGG